MSNDQICKNIVTMLIFSFDNSIEVLLSDVNNNYYSSEIHVYNGNNLNKLFMIYYHFYMEINSDSDTIYKYYISNKRINKQYQYIRHYYFQIQNINIGYVINNNYIQIYLCKENEIIYPSNIYTVDEFIKDPECVRSGLIKQYISEKTIQYIYDKLMPILLLYKI